MPARAFVSSPLPAAAVLLSSCAGWTADVSKKATPLGEIVLQVQDHEFRAAAFDEDEVGAGPKEGPATATPMLMPDRTWQGEVAATAQAVRFTSRKPGVYVSQTKPPLFVLLAGDAADVTVSSSGGAPGKPGEGGSHVADGNLQWVPAGRNPARQRPATSRNRVLRGPGVTPAAKRTQGVRKPRDGASKRTDRWSGRLHLGRTQHRSAVMRGAEVRPGPEDAANVQGDPQEPGRSCRLQR